MAKERLPLKGHSHHCRGKILQQELIWTSIEFFQDKFSSYALIRVKFCFNPEVCSQESECIKKKLKQKYKNV